MPVVLGVAVVALFILVLGLSFKIFSSNDDTEETAADSETTTEAVEESTTAPPTEAPTTAPPPTVSPTTPPPTTGPATTGPSTTRPAPPGVPPVLASEDELVGTVSGFISALDAGAIDAAYDYVSVPLRAREGWDYATFSRFWTENVSGASLVSVDDVSTSTGVVEVIVDYFLPDGATSREHVVMSFDIAGDAGLLVLVDYTVIDSEVI